MHCFTTVRLDNVNTLFTKFVKGKNAAGERGKTCQFGIYFEYCQTFTIIRPSHNQSKPVTNYKASAYNRKVRLN